jgi:glycosyltransferase involved in cell wall biosynthesis
MMRLGRAQARRRARSSWRTRRRGRPRVSVIVSCFNYERYVGEAISSALAQDGAATEVIVVDDGSSDGSRAAIEAFGDRVTALYKDNGGQASALNAGFRASSGDAVIFLDADDLLLPSAAAAVAEALSDAEIAKAHWPMAVIDAEGHLTGAFRDRELAEGDLRRAAIAEGPLGDAAITSAAMSGNAFPRWLLERVTPIPEAQYRIGADEYLFGLAPAFGPIVRLEPLSLYRVHGDNAHARRSFESMLSFQRAHYATIARAVGEACRREGRAYDEAAWERSAWWLRTARVVRAIEALVPAGERLALLDQANLGIKAELRGRHVVPFPQADGEFAGIPADEQAALEELEQLRHAGVEYLALAWPAFWWLDEFPALAAALSARGRLLARSEDVLVFGPAKA